jgi:hypothetical protein
MTPLPPKQLIQKYQLDQSQLAFTYCTLDPSGTTYIPDWSTTVYSTIMTGKISTCFLIFTDYIFSRKT